MARSICRLVVDHAHTVDAAGVAVEVDHHRPVNHGVPPPRRMRSRLPAHTKRQFRLAQVGMMQVEEHRAHE